jgi:isopentenyl-diphosphate delta-isomerase type 1
MRMGFILTVLALGSAWLSWRAGGWVGRLAFADAGLALGAVAAAQFLRAPGLLLKLSDGELSWWSWPLFWPYHLLSYASWGLYRLAPRGPLYHEILPGLVLGSRLGGRDARALCGTGPWAVLDLTSEFAESECLRRGRAYRSLPLLDHTAPSLDQLRDGVAFIEEHLRRGGVYVHCAVGHGRSATFVAACLLARGCASTPEQAVATLRSRRPGVRLNADQLEVLREFSAALGTDPRDEWFDVVGLQDEVLGRERRAEVHRRGLRHRAVHVLVFNARGDLFLQKRSMTKDTFPGAWDSSASGHVDAGESYDGCAVRELKEELGLAAETVPERLFKIDASALTGQEFVWVYRCRAEGPFTLHPEEIERGEWLSAQTITRRIQEQPEEYASAFRLIWGEVSQRGLLPG